ncbi:unnamed protein product [Adineta ricciae]|nr:unnamed protein product [Adineta ricciae]
MTNELSKPTTYKQNIELTEDSLSELNNNVQKEEVEMLIQTIRCVTDDMKKEVYSNRLIPNKIFDPLFGTLDSLQQTLEPSRLNVCYVIGASNAGKSTMINNLCGEKICDVSHSHIPGTKDFQEVSVPKVNAVFIDTVGFGANSEGDSDLVKKIETQMKAVQHPDAIILVVTRDHLRREKDLIGITNDINNILKWLKKQRYDVNIPIICVLNKIDEYFDGKVPTLEQSSEIENCIKEALTKVNKYLTTSATRCIAVSKNEDFGIDELRRNIDGQSPLNAQIIDTNLNYVARYRFSIANKIIIAFSTASAAVSFLPIVDIALTTLLQEWMYRMLACFSIDSSRTPDSFKAVHCVHQVASLAIRTGALFVGGVFQLTTVGYLIGSSLCVATAATSTTVLGWAAYSYFTNKISS